MTFIWSYRVMHEAKGCTIDNRPQHFKVDLPKELFLEGEWEVGVTELLYT